MKKTILLVMLLFVCYVTKAQLALEQNYTGSVALTQLSVSGYKYYLMDVVNNQCRIYNTDHSIWKTISLTVPAGNYLFDIKYVSENLFNADNNVELAYSYYSYDTLKYFYTYYTGIINESGTELLSLPGCSFLDIKSTGTGTLKMLAYVYDYSVVPYTLNTLVYSVPGSLPGGISLDGEGMISKPYPNPSSGMVTIPYHLQPGTREGKILLFGSSGQVFREYKIDGSFHDLIIQANDLPTGVLFYQVRTENGVIDSGQLIHLNR